MAKLKAKNRKKIKKSNFAVPKGKGKNKDKNSYPIHDKAHAKNALARVSQHGTAEEKKLVRKKVAKKFPSLKKKKKSK
jgi:hypothetical protein